MYETLLRLWKTRQLTAGQLQDAVQRDWITEEERLLILDEPQNPILR